MKFSENVFIKTFSNVHCDTSKKDNLHSKKSNLKISAFRD